MAALFTARAHLAAGAWDESREFGRLTLAWDERVRRRGVATLDGGAAEVLLDFSKPVRLHDGEGLSLEGGGVVRIVAAVEDLVEIACGETSLARLAYHLGNRHAPVEIAPPLLFTPSDPGVADLIRELGGDMRVVRRTFEPEGGAYARHAHG